MNRLPIELQNIICSYVGPTPSARVFHDLVECRQNEPRDDGGCYFTHWWRFYFKPNGFNPKEYLADIGLGEECVRCRWNKTWEESLEEGFDGMCAECYEAVYHPNQNEPRWVNDPVFSEDEYEEDDEI